MQTALRLLDKDNGQAAGFGRGARPDRARLRQGLDHEARLARGRGGYRGDLDRLARPRHRARHRRPAARPDHRDLRAGKLGQDDAGAARHRRGAEGRRHLRLHRRRARARPGLCQQARRQYRRSADLAARCRRAGARDRRHAGALGRDRRARHRFGRGPGAARRTRRRDGRQPYGAACPADEPGAAQADRLDLPVAARWSSSSTRSA